MQGIRIFALLAGVAGGGVIAARPSQHAVAQDSKPDWREQNAYTLGVQAYLYAFPWAYMPNARWLRTEAIDRQADRFDHIRHLEDAAHLSGGTPNNDTLYSRAWVYLKDEPDILTVPESPTATTQWRSSTSWATISPMSARAPRERRLATTRSSDPTGRERCPRA